MCKTARQYANETGGRKARKSVAVYLAGWHARIHGLFVDVDVLEDVNGLIKVAQERVEAAEADKGEIAQHLVERMHPELASHRLRIPASRENLKSFRYISLLL